MTVLLYVALIAAVTYELTAAITHQWPTISRLTWRLTGRYPQASFLFGLGFGLLLGHLFL